MGKGLHMCAQRHAGLRPGHRPPQATLRGSRFSVKPLLSRSSEPAGLLPFLSPQIGRGVPSAAACCRWQRSPSSHALLALPGASLSLRLGV